MLGSSLAEARTTQSLHRLGEYELVRRVATGGMAEVYEARRPGPRGFAKRVALKRILPQLARDARLVSMFCAEARVHAALQHPNLVSVLDFGEEGGELFLVLEYVDGVSLSDVLRAVRGRNITMELAPALHIAREVASGLAYAHEYRDDSDVPLGVVHRDVAPNNILLGRAGEVKLADFGIVHSTWSEVRTAPGELRGKIGYLSPEQSTGGAVEARSDLFSLGVVLAEMLQGSPLIPGNTELEVLKNLHSRNWENLSRLREQAPPAVVDLVERLLAQSPRHRPASAALVARELDKVASGHGARLSTHQFAGWLAGLGLVRADAQARGAAAGEARPPFVESRDEQPTIVDLEDANPPRR